MKNRVSILLVDDHPVVRKGLGSILSQHDHLVVVGEAVDGRDALQKAKELGPDLVLMDVDMPHMNGLAAADILRQEQPQTKILFLSMHSQPDYVARIIRSGARGYVLKDAAPQELVRAIETVQAGDTFFSPEVARLALNQFVRGNGDPVSQLTNRERDVLIQIADGLSNKEVATRLGIGVRTVETHRERVMRKLDIHSVAGLTKFAIARGLVVMPEKIKALEPKN